VSFGGRFFVVRVMPNGEGELNPVRISAAMEPESRYILYVYNYTVCSIYAGLFQEPCCVP
jgi:hypothetical protein